MDIKTVVKLRRIHHAAKQEGMKIAWVHVTDMEKEIELCYGMICFRDEKRNPAFGVLAKDVEEKL